MIDDEPRGFLVLPARGDPTTRALSDQVRTLAFKRFVAHDRRGLSPATARAIAAVQRHAYAARARLGEVFHDVDVRTCALALDGAYAEDAARALGARLAHLAALPWPTAPPPEPDEPAISPRLPALRLAAIDRNPLRFVEAHPDKDGNALALGGHPPTRWCAAVAEALDVIAAALPALVPELDVTLRRLVPIGFDAERHLSCSYREAPGVVYATLHPSSLTMAEALIHETQHGKLNLLGWLDPVLDNSPDQRVASPVRPDPRPLLGVLLAVHAFVPVAWLHHRLAELDHPLARADGFARRRREVLDGNAEGLRTLHAHARPTATGARVLAALDDLHAEVTARAGRTPTR